MLEKQQVRHLVKHPSEWFVAAGVHVQLHKGVRYPIIPGQPAWYDWLKYFEEINWLPNVFVYVGRDCIWWAPAQHPNDLDFKSERMSRTIPKSYWNKINEIAPGYKKIERKAKKTLS